MAMEIYNRCRIKRKEMESYCCCSWLIEDNIAISDRHYPGFPVNFIVPDKIRPVSITTVHCGKYTMVTNANHPSR